VYAATLSSSTYSDDGNDARRGSGVKREEDVEEKNAAFALPNIYQRRYLPRAPACLYYLSSHYLYSAFGAA